MTTQVRFITPYIALMRPHQWVKNIFIFAPAFFALQINLYNLLFLSVLFIGFCLIASAVYVFNDMFDRKADSIHPTKKLRPIASGAINLYQASIFGFVLLFFGGGVICLEICFLSPLNAPFLNSGADFGTSHILNSALESTFLDSILQYFTQFLHSILMPISIYIALNIAYTLGLKHIAVIDIFFIAFGFVLRLEIGAVALGIPLSHWIIIVTFLLALFLVLAKRRDDYLLLLQNGEKMRKNIDGYNQIFLDIAMSIVASLSVACYILYTIDTEIVAHFHTDKLYITALFVLLGFMRYMQLTFVYEKSADPSKIVLNDRFLQCVIVAYLLCFAAIVYYHRVL